MLETCAVTIRSEHRFAQTGVGWLLRELAQAEREAVLSFIRVHLARMSREGLRYVVDRLPQDERNALLDAHLKARRSSNITATRLIAPRPSNA
jgi:3-methyladenine DNA glycosylase AlkD